MQITVITIGSCCGKFKTETGACGYSSAVKTGSVIWSNCMWHCIIIRPLNGGTGTNAQVTRAKRHIIHTNGICTWRRIIIVAGTIRTFLTAGYPHNNYTAHEKNSNTPILFHSKFFRLKNMFYRVRSKKLPLFVIGFLFILTNCYSNLIRAAWRKKEFHLNRQFK